MQSSVSNQNINYKKRSVCRRFLFSVLLTLCSIHFGFSQFNIPDKPKKTAEQTSVYQYTPLLSESQKSSLEQKLIKYSDSTSTQIVVVIISSTQGENINYLGAQWGEKWGIGQAKEDNGVLIILAKDDRKIAINTGYGMEHLLTDAMSKRIIELDIIPYFKQNDYYGGLNRGVDAVFEVMTGEYKGTRKENTSEEFPGGFIILLFIIFIIVMISISKKNQGGGGPGNNKGGGFSIFDGRRLVKRWLWWRRWFRWWIWRRRLWRWRCFWRLVIGSVSGLKLQISGSSFICR